MGKRGEIAGGAGAALRHARLPDEHSVEINDEGTGGLEGNAQARGRVGGKVEVLAIVDLALLVGLDRSDADFGLHPAAVVVRFFEPVGRNGLGKDPAKPDILLVDNPGEEDGNVRLAWLSIRNENRMHIELDTHVVTMRYKEKQQKELVGEWEGDEALRENENLGERVSEIGGNGEAGLLDRCVVH